MLLSHEQDGIILNCGKIQFWIISRYPRRVGPAMSVTVWRAVGAFATAYVLIATERVHRVSAALGGAG